MSTIVAFLVALTAVSVRAQVCQHAQQTEAIFANVQEVRAYGRMFMRDAQAVIQGWRPYEAFGPELQMFSMGPSTPFHDFTLESERMVYQAQWTEAILNMVPLTEKMVEMEYEFLAAELNRLWTGLPQNIAVHGYMNSDLEHRRTWVNKVRLAMRGMIPERYSLSIPLPRYQPHDCSFISQPLNALRFVVNAIPLVDQAARCRFGDKWLSIRDQIHEKYEIRELDFYRSELRGSNLIHQDLLDSL